MCCIIPVVQLQWSEFDIYAIGYSQKSIWIHYFPSCFSQVEEGLLEQRQDLEMLMWVFVWQSTQALIISNLGQNFKTLHVHMTIFIFTDRKNGDDNGGGNETQSSILTLGRFSRREGRSSQIILFFDLSFFHCSDHVIPSASFTYYNFWLFWWHDWYQISSSMYYFERSESCLTGIYP